MPSEDVEYRCAGFVAEGLVQLTDVDHVMDVVHAALNPDPVGVAVEELAEDGIAADVEGRVIKLLGTVHNAVGAALRAVAIAQDASPVAAVAQDAKVEVTAIWIDPHLFVAQQGSGRRMVARYPLPRLKPSGTFAADTMTKRRLEPSGSPGPCPRTTSGQLSRRLDSTTRVKPTPDRSAIDETEPHGLRTAQLPISGAPMG